VGGSQSMLDSKQCYCIPSSKSCIVIPETLTIKVLLFLHMRRDPSFSVIPLSKAFRLHVPFSRIHPSRRPASLPACLNNRSSPKFRHDPSLHGSLRPLERRRVVLCPRRQPPYFR